MSETPWHAVRVHMPATGHIPAHAFEDAVRGGDRAEAENAARHNWITGTATMPALRIDYLGPEYSCGDRVRSSLDNKTGVISTRIEPSTEPGAAEISPRLFVQWDGIATEHEVNRADIAPVEEG